MMRRQMVGIRDRAQRTVVVTPLAIPTEKPARAKTNGHDGARHEETEVLASAT